MKLALNAYTTRLTLWSKAAKAFVAVYFAAVSQYFMCQQRYQMWILLNIQTIEQISRVKVAANSYRNR